MLRKPAVRCAFPRDELLVGNGIGRAGIINEDGVLLGRDVNVEGDASGTSLYKDASCAIDRSVEDFAAEVLEVVTQQVLGFYAEVERHTGEVLVVQIAVNGGFVTFLVVDGTMLQADVVGHEIDGVGYRWC